MRAWLSRIRRRRNVLCTGSTRGCRAKAPRNARWIALYISANLLQRRRSARLTRMSKRSYQVEWTETLHLPNGDVIRTERWKGLLSYRIAPLSTDEAIRANGAGFFITQFSWSKVLD